MQRFNVKEWLASGKHEHAVSILKHPEKIADYSPTVNDKMFAFSPSPFESKSTRSKFLISACERLFPGKGAVLALEDPVGIAVDLDALMEQRLADYMKGLVPAPSGQKVTRKHQIQIGGIIELFEKNIKDVAERSASDAALVNQEIWSPENPTGLGAPATPIPQERPAAITPGEIENKRFEAWEPYRSSTVYNDAARLARQKKNSDALKAFSKEKILPLAKAHVAWMESKALTQAFACNFDPENQDSGLVYLATLSQCIGSTQDKDVCAAHYEKLVMGSITDEKNLILRACAFNQNKPAKLIKAQSSKIPSTYEFWSGFISTLGGALEKTFEKKGAGDLLGKFLVQISGPFNAAFKKFSETGVFSEALLAVGGLSKSPIVRVEWRGRLDDAAEIIGRVGFEVRGEKAPYGFKAAVERRMKGLEIKGAPIDGVRQKNFAVVLELDELAQLEKTGKQLTQANNWTLTVHSPKDFDKLRLSRWRQNVVQSAKVKLPVVAGVLSALLQVFAVGTLKEELAKAEAIGEGEEMAQWRYYAGLATLAGGVIETLGKTLEASPRLVLRLGKGVFGRNLTGFLTLGGRILGAAAIAVVAALDAMKAHENWQKGNIGLTIAYTGSALLGITFAVLLFITGSLASLLTLLVLLASLALGIHINSKDPDALQKWLEAGVFGLGKFFDLEHEIQALQNLGLLDAPKGA